MIPVTEARKIIKEHTSCLLPVTVDIEKASGHVLAEDVYAACDIPPFHQSAMDGYAFVFSDWKNEGSLFVDGEVSAGSGVNTSLSPGKAVRIFTGAVVPDGADTVVMQERVSRKGEQLFIEDELLEEGKNIRRRGTEIQEGDLALPKGTVLTPAGVGFLSGVGIARVRVYPKPSVAVIVTGNELQSPGKSLQPGQIYESNSFMLRSALREMGVENIFADEAKDDLETLTTILGKALDRNDVVLLTGGVSVGDYDFVVRAAENCGVDTLFHKLKQRPGKPLYFGKKEKKLVFGLPGNPSSVLSCFYEYVWATLQALGGQERELKALRAPLGAAYSKKNAMTHFLKGVYKNGEVTPSTGQESFRLSSFARANCLIQLAEEVKDYQKGEEVEIHLLPVYG